jgi:acyl carrier protein
MNADQAAKVVLTTLEGIAPETGTADLDPRVDFSEQLDIDSMDFLNFVMAIHEQTGIEIPERDYPKLSSLEGAVAYLVAAG